MDVESLKQAIHVTVWLKSIRIAVPKSFKIIKLELSQITMYIILTNNKIINMGLYIQIHSSYFILGISMNTCSVPNFALSIQQIKSYLCICQ